MAEEKESEYIVNPLAQLPASQSAQFSLDKVDWQKLLRFLLVQLAGLALSFVPLALGAHYVWHGTDFTPVVVIVINTGAEAIRRFLSGEGPPAPQEPPAK